MRLWRDRYIRIPKECWFTVREGRGRITYPGRSSYSYGVETIQTKRGYIGARNSLLQPLKPEVFEAKRV